jgi:hypothetical protein
LTDFKLNFMYLCAVKYIIQRDLAGLSVWGGLGFCLGMLNRGFPFNVLSMLGTR